MRRAFRWLGVFWREFGIFLALLVALDAACAWWLGFRTTPYSRTMRCREEAENGAAWVPEYYGEQDGRSRLMRPVDYALWRQKPFSGRYLHIGDDGLRVTPNPPLPAAARPRLVYMFGGSTLWGYGSRDGHTIAALLSKGLGRAGAPAVVVNFGEWSYVNGQETAALLRELVLRRRRPDVVVFFDGLNDMELAAMPRYRKDASFSSYWRVMNPYAWPTDGRLILNWGKSSAIWRAAVWRSYERGYYNPAPVPAADCGPIAGAIAARYARSAKAVEGLGREFHFRPVFYWQPTLAEKARLSPIEAEAAPAAEYILKNRLLFKAARAAVDEQMKGDPNFHDIAGLFSQDSATVYSDGEHYTEAANARVALRMLPDVLRAVQKAGKRSRGGR